tara:strand:+ start:157 stop:729 length:573 start_codon:yes stop_codon:yes gene_type:complete
MKEYSIPYDKVMHAWYMPHDLCDDLINYFEDSSQKEKGKVGDGIDERIKKSTDVSLQMNSPLFADYNQELQKGIDAYEKKYPLLRQESKYDNLNECTNIQKYLPGEGFYELHTERENNPVCIKRIMVYMTYLNDCENAGTEWPYVGVKVPHAEKGLSVLWSADYPYAHKGLTENVNDIKYIATGWLSYAE